MEKQETLQIEFKSEKKAPISDHELLDEVVGMANAKGGKIYLGVEDDGSFSGASKIHQDIDGLRAMIANKTVPSVFVNPILLMENEVIVVEIEVPLENHIVATSQGKIMQRRLKADGTPEVVPFFPWEFSSRQSFLSEFDPSSSVIEDLTISDIDDDSLKFLKKEVEQSSLSDTTLLNLEDEEFLLSLGLVQKFENTLNMTFAGLLLLGKEESLKRFAPGARFVYQILDKGRVLKNEEHQENIVQAFKRFENFTQAFNFEDEMLIKMRRVGVLYFDREGLREAFANAVVHRDYSRLDPVRVIYDETGLTISNPGGLIYGLKLNHLLSAEPRGRNPLLSMALKRCGYCEKTGRGIDKIYFGQARYGKRWPDYLNSDDGSIVLFIPKSEIDESFALTLLTRYSQLPIFSVLILSYIRRYHLGVKQELMEALGVSQARLESYLIPLLTQGLIRPIDKEGPWQLSSVFESDNDLMSEDALLDSIVDLAKENDGFITNSIVQKGLGIDNSKSYVLIKKLVKQNRIQLVQSGKYAKYKLIK